MNNLCVIPARGGSKGILRKNIKLFCGKPLVARTIECALATNIFDVVVSTEDEEIANISLFYGARVCYRSQELASDHVHAVHAIIEAVQTEEMLKTIDVVMMLPPTSPLRTTKSIIGAYDMFSDNKFDSVIGVYKTHCPISSFRYKSDNGILSTLVPIQHYEVQRQDIENAVYVVNGSIYISTPKHLKGAKSFHKGMVGGYVMSKNESFDINDLDDWYMAECMCAKHEQK